MSRPKISANQVNAAGTTNGQILTSDGTNAAWQTPAPKLDALPNGTTVSVAKTFASAGDANGVFYFLGTQLGASNWANPQTTAQIVAVRSTDGAGTVADIFDRTTNATYTNGGALGDFIFVDLGVNRSLVPNYYSLRNYNQPNREMRTWKLQGTNSVAGTSVAQINAATWTDLDVRSGDTTMSGASAWANYTPNQSNTTAFRYLRILQTGNDATGGPYICVAEWELYGTLNYTSSALVDGRIVQVDGTGGLDLRQTSFSAVGSTLSATGNVTITSEATNGSVTLTPTGTGSSTINGPVILPNLTANRVILSNGSSALQTVAPGTSGNVLTSNGTTWTSATPGGGVDYQAFTSSGTWTKPSGAKAVEVICLGAGGGGGSGRKGGTAQSNGGSGGAGGALARMTFPADLFSSTETVTVGAGGTGGASQTTNATNGNAGNAGGNSTFGNWLYAGGGDGGPGGASSASQNGSAGGSVARDGTFNATDALSGQAGSRITGVGANAEYGGGGGANFTSGGDGRAGGSSIFGGPGGGSGGTIISNIHYAGGPGGNTASRTEGGGGTAGTSGGGAGTAGAAPAFSLCGTGGGGGGANNSGNAGAGGAGGRGAGGGGGGAAIDSLGNSGAGGNGGNGLVIVITYK